MAEKKRLSVDYKEEKKETGLRNQSCFFICLTAMN